MIVVIISLKSDSDHCPTIETSLLQYPHVYNIPFSKATEQTSRWPITPLALLSHSKL